MIANVFEVEQTKCGDCAAPLQPAPAWRETPAQLVYRCPWTTLSHFRVDFESPNLLVYNCNWPKGIIARRVSESIR